MIKEILKEFDGYFVKELPSDIKEEVLQHSDVYVAVYTFNCKENYRFTKVEYKEDDPILRELLLYCSENKTDNYFSNKYIRVRDAAM